jgi:translation elongation factor EF-Tu-like GTPase
MITRAAQMDGAILSSPQPTVPWRKQKNTFFARQVGVPASVV